MALFGAGLTYDGQGNLIGGVIQAIGKADNLTNTILWLIEDLSIPAQDFDAASLTTSGSDDIALFQTALSAGDFFFLSEFSDHVFGYAGDDYIDGAAAADTMEGGTGNDFYVVDDPLDAIVEKKEEGFDTIISQLASYSLEKLKAVENLVYDNFDDADLDFTGTGNKMDNVIVGGDANDLLDGLKGADILAGGLGNDTYVVDKSGADIVDETSGDGTDTVRSNTSFNLSDPLHAIGDIENLTLLGKGDATGNALANELIGSSSKNVLAGLGGADFLDGGDSTDTASYAASLAGVNVSLATGSGSGGDAQGDTIVNIENLTGSGLDDTLEGNAGKNRLDGGLGVDTVSFEHALVPVTVDIGKGEAKGDGSDTLVSFENVTGSNFADIITGSAFANMLKGLDGADTINAGAGNDFLFGGNGSDILGGGTEADVFVFKTGETGSDIVTDFVSGTDRIDLSSLFASIGQSGQTYDALVAAGYLQIDTGNVLTETSSNSATLLDTEVYFDADGNGGDDGWLVATLEDAVTASGDFIV